MFIVEADDMEKVRKAFEKDVYYKYGVSDFVSCSTLKSYRYLLQWDLEKLLIFPWVPTHSDELM
jgi:hypothetical protein